MLPTDGVGLIKYQCSQDIPLSVPARLSISQMQNEKSRIRMSKRMLYALWALLCISGEASANAGLPMIFLVMPAFGLSIIPIILIEAVYLSRKMGLVFREAAKATTISNLISTLVGIPVTWLLLVIIQILAGGGAYGLDTTRGKVLSVTLQAPWLIPYESELYWMIPTAGLFLLVPFFFVSWWSEYLVSKQILKDRPEQSVKIGIRNANIITYALLAFWPVGFWLIRNAS
jgi:hypothetical protein